MLVLTCEIGITRKGKKIASFSSVSEIVIKHSLFNMSSTAIIKLPLSAMLKYTNEEKWHVEELNNILKNDKVVIQLGYNNELKTEFTGYIKRFNYSTPGTIECENIYLKMRDNNKDYDPKEAKAKLEDVIKFIFPEVEIAHCADLTLKNLMKEQLSGELFLRKLKRDYNVCIFFDLDEKLHIGQPDDMGLAQDTIKYQFGLNTIKNEELKYHYTDDTPIKIKATCYLKDGEEIKVEVGEDGGEEKSISFYDVEDEKQLKALAKAELTRYQASGFRGKLTAFLQPYAFPGMIADINDPIYTDKNGQYLIESVETSYSKSGGRRQIGIGMMMP